MACMKSLVKKMEIKIMFKVSKHGKETFPVVVFLLHIHDVCLSPSVYVILLMVMNILL